MKRGLTYAEARDYVGVKRRTFDHQWRPRLTALHQGTTLIFDRRDLDVLFDRFKRQTAAGRSEPEMEPAALKAAQNGPWNGRPIVKKGVKLWAEKQGESSPVKTGLGRLTGGGEALDFAGVASKVLRKQNAG